MKVFLASGSPRRRQLLETLGHVVVVEVPRVSEEPQPGETPEALVVRLARSKAGSVRDSRGLPVVAADTVVVIEEEILGKPEDSDDARAMLRKLSGREHRVISGYCVRRGAEEVHGWVSSIVSFRTLDEDSINEYLATGEPLDKAGGYGVQGRGAALVRDVVGSYSNVVGLPLDEVLDALQERGDALGRI